MELAEGSMKKILANKRVLITGAGGFIGSHLCEECLAEGAQVKAFVHYNSRGDWGMLEDLRPRDLGKIEVIAGDLRDGEAVRRAVKGSNVVFHLGALIGIPYSYVNPADVVSTNIVGTLHVLQAGLECRVERHIQTSTSEVYGSARYVPMDENHPLNPQSPYAASKIGADKLAESFFKTYDLPVTIVRPFNTYGPRQSPRAVIPTIIGQALDSSRVRLGSLEPRRDLTFVADTVRGFVAAAVSTKSVGQTIQLGSQQETSVAELVNLIGTLLNKKLKVLSDARRRRPPASEVERLLADNGRAAELLNWRPQMSLVEGLRATVDWYQVRGGRHKRNLYHI
jgi:NAD dependent epimerase/dehydratase